MGVLHDHGSLKLLYYGLTCFCVKWIQTASYIHFVLNCPWSEPDWVCGSITVDLLNVVFYSHLVVNSTVVQILLTSECRHCVLVDEQ